MSEELDYDKSVEDLIRELREISAVYRKLDTSNMPERTRGFVQGILLGLGLAIKPPTPGGVEFVRIIAAAYERKYGFEPEDEVKIAETLRQVKADLEEMKKRPDWEERLQRAEKYMYWPSGPVE